MSLQGKVANIATRKQVEVNTDPQRRCYYGVYPRSELRWTEWEVIDFDIPYDKVESRLSFWRELNDGAISARGEGARREFKIV